MNPEMSMVVKRNEEREALLGLIHQWNTNRLDLFALSEPNDDLEFHGVMRFYFQDSGQKVATKCIRVASDATAQVVIETLIEKFRADMRMLSVPEYALYEIHENGDERRLNCDEQPLLVQLNWHKDDREGRFLLRRIDDKTNMPEGTFQESGSSFRRKLSKREKKQLKKQEKLNRMKSTGGINNDENDSGVAEKLYTEIPETSFTRSISNPEAVMRRRRQQKLEKKLQQFRSKDGGPDTGGTLKIYGESLCRDVPYKTLLLSVGDTATNVVKEMLMKYGLDREDPHNYCLVQVNTAIDSNAENKDSTSSNSNTINNREYILDEDECPLAILMNHPQSRGSIMFHVRRRPADYHPRKRKKKPQQKWNQQGDLDNRYDSLDRLPYFLELNPDGTDVSSGSARRHRLHPNVTEVGSERASPHSQSQSLQLFGPNVQPRHCVIAHTEGIVTVTPCSRDAETYVNGQRIYETTILQSGMIVQFGRIHSFRFLDPCQEDRRLRQDSSRPLHDYSYDRQSNQEEQSPGSTNQDNSEQITSSGSTVNYETTFDVDGNIETRSTSSQGNRDETRSQRSVGSSRDGNRLSNYERYPRGTDPILPAVLEIREETEEALLHALINDMEPNSPAFKLAPAYTLYLAARYRASTHYKPELTPTERARKLTLILARVAIMIHNVIQERYCDVKSLALWLANSSELLHFLKSDRHVSAFSLDAQDTLAESVQISFRHLIACLQRELDAVMPDFLSERDDIGLDSEDPATASVIGVLTSAMQLLRRCRVNAALTIQLFSQLFYFINIWTFNNIVRPNSVYCSRAWGVRIKSRIGQIEAWALRQGLELAADCHLSRLMHVANIMLAPKYTADDLAALSSSSTYKLNSLQLGAILRNYQPMPDEPRVPHEMIDNVVRTAESLADEIIRADGREIRLEEDLELAIPFMLPEDGYSCEVVRGVPQGLVDFIAPLQHAGLCRLSAQPTSNGLWTVYMGPTNANMVRSPSAMSNRSAGYAGSQQEPEVQTIRLHKSNNGMGLSIVAAKGAGQDRLGIYIKSVVKGGAADADGRLQAGDQLLKVDGQCLVGITQEKAAEYLVKTGPVVTLEVAKQGAIFHGLATLLSQPSPVMGRGPRRMSERDLPARVLSEQNQNLNHHNQLSRTGGPMFHAPIHSSKSVPSLNSGSHETGSTMVGGGGPQMPMSPNLVRTSGGAVRAPHEVFNPGYSRTSSTNSLPQKTNEIPNTLRSRSSQNLAENRPIPSSNLVSRQASNPSLLQHQHHQLHQQQNNQPQSPSYLPYQQQMAMQHQQQIQQQQQQQQQLYQQQQSQNNIHNSNSNIVNHSSNGQITSPEGERFYQNLSVYRNQEMSNGYLPQSHPGVGRGKMPSPQDERSPNLLSSSHNNINNKSFRGSQSSLSTTSRPPSEQQMAGTTLQGPQGPGQRDRPSSAYLPPHGHHLNQQNMAPRSQSSRDMLRQEAKLQEMTEEVRRREMRVTSPQHYPLQRIPGQNMGPISPNSIGPNNPSRLTQQGTMPQQQGPPQNSYGYHTPDSNPAYPNRLPKQQPARTSAPGNPGDEIAYRDSPPPPPPPTSTHPLYQRNDARYTASMGEPPRGGYYPPSPSSQQPQMRQYQFQGTNPWEREEKEKEALRRREAARHWRDQQIAELTALGPNRNPQQEERLRALCLEKEFQRRAAMEDEDDDEEDQEATERVQGLLRVAQNQSNQQQNQQQQMQTAQQNHHQQPQPQQQISPDDKRMAGNKPALPNMNNSGTGTLRNPQMNGIVGRTTIPPNSNINTTPTGPGAEEKERLRRLKELKMKQAEMEAERGIKRREEEIRQNNGRQQHQQQQALMNQANINSNTIQRPTRFEGNLIINSPASPGTIPNGYGSNPAQQRLDNLLGGQNMPPQPPERGSSFAIMSQTQLGSLRSPVPTNQNSMNNISNNNNNNNVNNNNIVNNGMNNSTTSLSSNGGGSQIIPNNNNNNHNIQNNNSVNNPNMTTPTGVTIPSGGGTAKRVSFQDSTPTPPSPPSSQPPLENIREDPNHFIDEAETLLASPKTPDTPGYTGTTPGVIGAQEVYKDPRQRRLQEQQQKNIANKVGTVPEKLSFKEKMKMFAMETGEDGTPRDKVKISRAQRDIDNLGTPPGPGNANNNVNSVNPNNSLNN